LGDFGGFAREQVCAERWASPVVFRQSVDADFAPLDAPDNPAANLLISLNSEKPSTPKLNTTAPAFNQKPNQLS
jgi:hypothetical protein